MLPPLRSLLNAKIKKHRILPILSVFVLLHFTFRQIGQASFFFCNKKQHFCIKTSSGQRKLAVIKLRIKALLLQQRLMRSLFYDFPFFHNENHIGFPDRG